MSRPARFLAFDLGAESGRAVVGSLVGDRLHLEEIHRFANRPVRAQTSLHWDALRLWTEIRQGLGLAVKTYGRELCSIGLDTWGVDFGLLAADDTLLGNPYHYRDRRTSGMMEEAFKIVARSEIYQRTGVQFLELNSLYQLLAMVKKGAKELTTADTFLTMADLFNFWLTGCKANEFTIATTTQCYDPSAGTWAWDMLARLGIPLRIFGEIVHPGTVLGPLRPAVAVETGAFTVPVVATAAHDTASAVAAAPALGGDSIYLSSGTWSLMGAEVRKPIINDQGLAYNFTNEGGVGGTFRFLKNIAGLWLVQECRRQWARGGESLSYVELTRLAAESARAESPGTAGLVSLRDSRFIPPGDMPVRIQAFCRETGQTIPLTRGEIVRCALESLALEYRRTVEELEDLLGRGLPVVHVIGGGSRNELLNQLTADATGRTVIAGPGEATATGNVLVQALALGEIDSLAQGRELVRRSCELVTFEPRPSAAWDEVYQRYLSVSQRQNAS